VSTRFFRSAGIRKLRFDLRAPRGAVWERLSRALTSTWTLGLLVAIASWNVAFVPPFGGLESSWNAALYMAAHRGLGFGSQIVFTYGPLGFLRTPFLWYGDLGVLAFLYHVVINALFSISLVWALRRTLNAAAAVLLTYFVLIAALNFDVPLALATVWCLIALSPSPQRPPFASSLVLFGGAVLGAIETLVSPRSGPVICAMCVITLLAQERWRRNVPIFVACWGLGFMLLWFLTGQEISNLPDFVQNGAQIVSGYSEAMGLQCVVCWAVTPASSSLYLPATLLLGAALVAAAAISSAPGRPRLAAAAVTGVVTFTMFKEAVVRADFGHTWGFFAMVAGVGAALAFGRRRLVAVGVVAALAVLSIESQPALAPIGLSPIDHVRQASHEVHTLLSPARRKSIAMSLRGALIHGYRLDPTTLGLLRGHTVHVDPWEAAVAWWYRLKWHPLPVFQDYSAYTAALDRLNANALRSQNGPQRILREHTAYMRTRRESIDSRFVAWDPPAQTLTMLCNYVPLRTTDSWQVLGKVPDRCGAPQQISSIHTHYGNTVRIPPAKAGGLLYAKVHGAGVSGLERLRTLLYRAKFRYVRINGTTTYRLVPGTAADGLLMNTSPKVDYPGPFRLSPDARTIALTGSTGALRVDLYWMRVGPPDTRPG
jgi:hypothetical protein